MKKLFKTLTLSLSLFSILYGQSLINPQEAVILDRENKKYESSIERFYKTRSVTRNIAPQVLDDQLDADNYFIGPGDQFSLHLFGELENEFIFTVLPEGEIDIPTVGSLQVNGLSLKQAKNIIYNEVRANYVKSDVSIKLVSLRRFRVYLTGEVQIPGTYFAQGSDRVSDIIEVSGGLTDWADDTAIEIIHIDGSRDVVNISEFYRNSDKSQNPFVRGGDIIYATPFDLTKPYVMVESRIDQFFANAPSNKQLIEDKSTRNIHRLLPDETVTSFLRRIAAYSGEVDLSNITLRRENVEYTIDVLNEFDKYSEFKLLSKDLLIIPDLVSEVYVQGEVLQPGSFPFTVNMRAKDYAGMAGIQETAVGLNALLVIRAGTNKVEKGGDIIVEKGDTVVVGRKVRETFKDYITILAPVVTLFVSAYTLLTR